MFILCFSDYVCAQASSEIVILYIAAYNYEASKGIGALPHGLDPTGIPTRSPMCIFGAGEGTHNFELSAEFVHY